MQVNKHTIQELDPDKLSDGITTGKATIDVTDITTGLLLLEKLIQALAGRKQLSRRVNALENIVSNQQNLLEMLAAKL